MASTWNPDHPYHPARPVRLSSVSHHFRLCHLCLSHLSYLVHPLFLLQDLSASAPSEHLEEVISWLMAYHLFGPLPLLLLRAHVHVHVIPYPLLSLGEDGWKHTS